MITPEAAPGKGAAEPPVWGPARDLGAPEEVAPIEIAPALHSKTRPGGPARRTSSTTALIVVAALVAFGGVGFAVGHLSPDPPMSGRWRLGDGPEQMIDSVSARDRTLTWANAGRRAVGLAS